MPGFLSFVNKVLKISSVHIVADILSKEQYFDEKIKCFVEFFDAEYTEKFVLGNAVICIGDLSDYERYGEAKITDSFYISKGENKKFDFEIEISYDEQLIGKESKMFLLLEFYKNPYSKRRLACPMNFFTKKREP